MSLTNDELEAKIAELEGQLAPKPARWGWADWVATVIGSIAFLYLVFAYFFPATLTLGGGRPTVFVLFTALTTGVLSWVFIRRSTSGNGETTIDDLLGWLFGLFTGAVLVFGPTICSMAGIVANTTTGPTVTRIIKTPGEEVIKINQVKGVKVLIELPDATGTDQEMKVDPKWHGKVWTQSGGVDSGAASF